MMIAFPIVCIHIRKIIWSHNHLIFLMEFLDSNDYFILLYIVLKSYPNANTIWGSSIMLLNDQFPSIPCNAIHGGFLWLWLLLIDIWTSQGCYCSHVSWDMASGNLWIELLGHSYSISQEICTRFGCVLLCCGYAIVNNEFTWSIYTYSSGLLCWHCGNR